MHSQQDNSKSSKERKAYEDLKIKVDVGVDGDKHFPNLHFHRQLNNCIRITAFGNDVHFIQFVTRQVPDLFTFENTAEKKLIWDVNPDVHYMGDSVHPKWKLDVTENSTTCYYEEKGLNTKAKGFVSMYDYPGGTMEFPQERCVFCTFVIIDKQITHLVQWSKQYDTEEEEFYDVKVQLWTLPSLPFWAIKVLNMHCDTKKINIPEVVSRDTLLKLQSKSEEDITEESSLYFLKPSRKWLTFVKYPDLFPEFLCTNKIDEVLGNSFPRDVKSLILEYSNLPALPQATDPGSKSIAVSIKAPTSS